MIDAGARPAPRAARGAGVFVAVVLLATVDTRAFGLIPDGKEMLSAAGAVARFFEIGVSRDFGNAPRRAAGDAVSRYGMGLSLAEVIPATAARLLRAAAPDAPSAPVFVLLPIACLVASAWATARALLRMGATLGWAGVSGAGLVFATPLWGYAASDYGEPLQACCLALLLLASVELRDDPASRRWQIVAGSAAGFAVLTKTLLLVAVAPFLLHLFFGKKDFLEGKRADPRRRDKVGVPRFVFLSFAAILVLWSVLEFARFGRLFGGYSGETFSYPFFTGLLRLTVYPNKGLFWYAPFVLLAPLGFLALARRSPRFAFATFASGLSLLFAASSWWAWDGQAGWGPRLLLPALPPFVFLAGLACSSSGRSARVGGALALCVGCGVNLLGALVPFPAVYALSDVVPVQPILEIRAAGTAYEIERGADGVLRATAPHHLSLTPEWSPIRVHALLLAAKLRGHVSETLAREGLPSLDPPFRPVLPKEPAPATLLALHAVRVGWGLQFLEARRDGPASWADPWLDALRDQAVRAIDLKDYARARALGGELLEKEKPNSGSSNDPRAIALIAESLRLEMGQGAAASLSFLSRKSSSPSPAVCNPWILFVRSMADPPGDLSCIPEAQREPFASSLDIARRQGWTLTSWARAIRGARP